MLKDLFKLLVSCVSEPAETISRVGCSCIRSDAAWNKTQFEISLCKSASVTITDSELDQRKGLNLTEGGRRDSLYFFFL